MAGSTTLRPPFEHPILNPQTGLVTEPWHLFFLRLQTANNGNAPADAEYVVGATSSYLINERVGTNSTSNTWDFATAGQAKVKRAALTGDVTASADSNATTIAAGAVSYAKMQAVSAASRLLGRGSAGGAGNVEELTLGANLSLTGTVLDAVSGGVSTVTHTVGIVIDGAGAAIATGVKGFIQVPFTGTIASVTLLSSDASATSGSLVIDIWKDTYANYPPTVADTITAAAKPTLSAANKYTDSTLTGWTTSITAGDVLGFNVDSCAGITRATLQMKVTATT